MTGVQSGKRVCAAAWENDPGLPKVAICCAFSGGRAALDTSSRSGAPRVQQGVLQAAADLHECGVEHTGRAAVFPGALLHAVRIAFFSFGVEHRQTRLLF